MDVRGLYDRESLVPAGFIDFLLCFIIITIIKKINYYFCIYFFFANFNSEYQKLSEARDKSVLVQNDASERELQNSIEPVESAEIASF